MCLHAMTDLNDCTLTERKIFKHGFTKPGKDYSGHDPINGSRVPFEASEIVNITGKSGSKRSATPVVWFKVTSPANYAHVFWIGNSRSRCRKE